MTTSAPESKSSAKSDKPPSSAARIAKSVAESVEAKTSKVRQSAEKAARKTSAKVAREPTRRKLTDPAVMRALAHPVRVELIETLLREGPLTATAAAALLDDSPGNMSWHLNVLAKYGFVEEAEGGRGRARPWRLVNLGTEYSEEDDNPELNVAAETMSRVIIDRNRDRAQRWLNERSSYPVKWRKAAFGVNSVAYVTPEEMEELGKELGEVMSKFRERTYDKEKRPKGARPVAVTAFGHPITPSPTGN